MKLSVLDVGCGPDGCGNVNVDLVFNGRIPYSGTYVDAEKISNPVKADAHYLPFKDETFSSVYSRALLEHVDDPSVALKEMMRVARNEVFFIVPHRFFREGILKGQPKTHKHFFSTLATKKWVRNCVGYIPITRIMYKGFPSDTISLVRLPWLIEASIKK